MVGTLICSYTYSKDENYSILMAAFGSFLIGACWVVWSVTLHYGQESSYQYMSWFGMMAALMSTLPYAGHKRFISTDVNGLESFMGIACIITAVGIGLLATVVQHGPCQL